MCRFSRIFFCAVNKEYARKYFLGFFWIIEINSSRLTNITDNVALIMFSYFDDNKFPLISHHGSTDFECD